LCKISQAASAGTRATHLAIAVGLGAERFITNNRGDFGPHITEIDVTHPDDLPDQAAPDPETPDPAT